MDDNRLLRALPMSDRSALGRVLDKVELKVGTVLEIQGEATPYAYFLEAGLASVVACSPNRRIGVGVIGCDGVTALEVLHCAERAGHDVSVQAPSIAWRIETSKLHQALIKSETLRTLLLRYAQFFTVQASQTALTNGRATMEERLARWILMAHDRMKVAILNVTHSYIALMLGVRRAGVTDAMHILEGKRLIASRRNTIHILDRRGLIQVTGGAYGICESEYERLIDSTFRVDVQDEQSK